MWVFGKRAGRNKKNKNNLISKSTNWNYTKHIKESRVLNIGNQEANYQESCQSKLLLSDYSSQSYKKAITTTD